MTLRDGWLLLKDAGVKFWGDRGPQLGASMAYYTALSLSPLLLVVVAVAGLMFGREAARGEIVEQFREVIGAEAATVVEQLVVKSSSASQGIAASVVAFAVLVFGASNVFSELQGALNAIWKVPGKHGGGVFALVKERLFSFSLVCGSAFLLLVSLVVTAVLAGMSHRVPGWLPGTDALVQVLNFVLNFALTAALFAMIFKWLPETRLTWRSVGVGAVLTALLFSVGRYLIGLYLGRAAVGSAYGAAGAFVVLMVWVYYSTQILLFGAELTFVYAQRFGSLGRTADGSFAEADATGGQVEPAGA